tara:strand:+ start:7797 stop:8279 length:483 start_codon:yes stop_codon:yes gene_type:complete
MNRHMEIEQRMESKNKAEKYFENEFNYKHRDTGGFCYKYGLDDLNVSDKSIKNLKLIPAFIRNTPDFIVVYENKFQMVEVKCCGENLWLKIPDHENYKLWNDNFPVLFFIYSFKYEKYVNISLKNLDNLINENDYKIDKHFDSWKKCWVIPFNDILMHGK